jgi:hypothetical protein
MDNFVNTNRLIFYAIRYRKRPQMLPESSSRGGQDGDHHHNLHPDGIPPTGSSPAQIAQWFFDMARLISVFNGNRCILRSDSSGHLPVLREEFKGSEFAYGPSPENLRIAQAVWFQLFGGDLPSDVEVCICHLTFDSDSLRFRLFGKSICLV